MRPLMLYEVICTLDTLENMISCIEQFVVCKYLIDTLLDSSCYMTVHGVPGLVLGEQSTPTVSHCTTNGSGGTTGCPHRQWEAWLVPPASSLPGLQECS